MCGSMGSPLRGREEGSDRQGSIVDELSANTDECDQVIWISVAWSDKVCCVPPVVMIVVVVVLLSKIRSRI